MININMSSIQLTPVRTWERKVLNSNSSPLINIQNVIKHKILSENQTIAWLYICKCMTILFLICTRINHQNIPKTRLQTISQNGTKDSRWVWEFLLNCTRINHWNMLKTLLQKISKTGTKVFKCVTLIPKWNRHLQPWHIRTSESNSASSMTNLEKKRILQNKTPRIFHIKNIFCHKQYFKKHIEELLKGYKMKDIWETTTITNLRKESVQ